MELYRKVRLACRDGMSERAAARHPDLLALAVVHATLRWSRTSGTVGSRHPAEYLVEVYIAPDSLAMGSPETVPSFRRTPRGVARRWFELAWPFSATPGSAPSLSAISLRIMPLTPCALRHASTSINSSGSTTSSPSSSSKPTLCSADLPMAWAISPSSASFRVR